MRIKFIAAIVVSVLFSTDASTEVFQHPFGIKMGQSIESLEAEPGLTRQGTYILRTAPEPHHLFDHYQVVAGGRSGVCAIIAGSRSTASEFADKDIETVTRQISQVLGKPAHTSDPSRSNGNVWAWVTALPKLGECAHLAGDAQKVCLGAPAPLDTTLDRASLTRIQEPSGKASFVLYLVFKNMSGCDAEHARNTFR